MGWHKNIHKWLSGYLWHLIRSRSCLESFDIPCHVMFCIADHYEPFVGRVPLDTARKRVSKWRQKLPIIADQCRDSDGIKYRHTFFYPAEEYHEEVLSLLAEICHAGYGETEVHLHHDNDDSNHLRKTLLKFKKILAENHNLLCRNKDTGDVQYGFIHGNWALDNSRPDGRWCGVNDELNVLRETGCFADFTMPSAPNITQTSKINSIYYAKDDPKKPKSHNTGVDAVVGRRNSENLLLVQGPLTLDWKARKRGFLPAIENGEIGFGRPPSLERFKIWFNQGIHLKKRSDWIFIKVHTHGAIEKNADVLLGPEMKEFFDSLGNFFAKNNRINLHYVTAREMVNIIRAAEAGETGSPGDYRDFELVTSY